MLHRLSQRAGTLAVDYRDGVQLAHDGGIDVPLQDGYRLQRLHAAQVQLRGHRRLAERGRAGGHHLFLRLLFGHAHLVLAGRHVHYTRSEAQRTILIYARHLGLYAHGEYLHRVAHHGGPRGAALFLGHGGLFGKVLLRLVEAPPQLGAGLVRGAVVLVGVRPGAHLVYLGEGGLRRLARLGNYPLRVPLGLHLRLLQAQLELDPYLGRLLAVLLGLAQLLLRLLPVALQRLAHGLELFNRGLEAGALGADAALCVRDYLLRHAQALRDGEGVGLAGDAHQQPVGRAQGRHVELAGGVHDALGGRGVDLQLRVVRRRRDDGAVLPRVLDYGDGQGRALGGVRACAQLVEEDERIRAAFTKYAHDVCHVRGKGGEVLLYALLVAYVREHGSEHGHAAPVRYGQVQSAGGHDAHEAYGLERDRLAAGVRAGDDQGVVVAAEGEVYGHGGVLGQQRVAGLAEHHGAL